MSRNVEAVVSVLDRLEQFCTEDGATRVGGQVHLSGARVNCWQVCITSSFVPLHGDARLQATAWQRCQSRAPHQEVKPLLLASQATGGIFVQQQLVQVADRLSILIRLAALSRR